MIPSVPRIAAAVDRYVARQAMGRAVADRLVAALDVIPQGIVLADVERLNERATQALLDAVAQLPRPPAA